MNYHLSEYLLTHNKTILAPVNLLIYDFWLFMFSQAHLQELGIFKLTRSLPLLLVHESEQPHFDIRKVAPRLRIHARLVVRGGQVGLRARGLPVAATQVLLDDLAALTDGPDAGNVVQLYEASRLPAQIKRRRPQHLLLRPAVRLSRRTPRPLRDEVLHTRDRSILALNLVQEGPKNGHLLVVFFL